MKIIVNNSIRSSKWTEMNVTAPRTERFVSAYVRACVCEQVGMRPNEEEHARAIPHEY